MVENNVDKYVVTYVNKKTKKAKTYILFFWMYETDYCFPIISKIYRLPKDFKPQEDARISKFNGVSRDLLNKSTNIYGSEVYYEHIIRKK